MIPLLVFLEHYKDLISMHNKGFNHYKVWNILTMSFGALKKNEIQDLQDPSFMMIPSFWGVSLSPLFTFKVLALLIWKIKSKRREALNSAKEETMSRVFNFSSNEKSWQKCVEMPFCFSPFSKTFSPFTLNLVGLVNGF